MSEPTDTSPISYGAAQVAVVACCFSMDPIVFKDRLVRLGERLDVTMHGVVVANGSHVAILNDPDWTLIHGTNDDLDFSGYAQGAEHWLKNKQNMPNVILFVNDSLFTSHSAIANLRATLRLILLLGDIRLPAIVGKADRYTTIVHQNPWSSLGIYVSTYCFALNARAIGRLLQLSNWANEDGLGHEVDISDSNWGHGLSLQFREFLRANIYYQGSPYAWHSLDRNIENIQLLRKKARCIYFEHRLSGEIAKDGCVLPTNAGPRAGFRLFLAEGTCRLYRRFLG